jgi:phospho-N-acetylmuramoyl-pentapeptide-transferase
VVAALLNKNHKERACCLNWLAGCRDSRAFFALFDYLTMRAILGALTAMALSLWLGPSVIERLPSSRAQPIRSDGPQSHFVKAGTPTMGGALLLLTITLSTLLWGDLRNRYIWLLLAVTIAFGAIGWWDDWIKIVRRDPNGMRSPRQVRAAVVAGLLAAYSLLLPPTFRGDTAVSAAAEECRAAAALGLRDRAYSGSSVFPTRST